ncbi:MAG: DUF1501 domain-containing protein [Limnohabitans sp.]|jgi:uncharacterized protein (DUF1501 family)
MNIDRRNFMGATALLATPIVSFAKADTDRRFVFIIQRGAADGLNIVVPYADPNYLKLRGNLAIEVAAPMKLDGTFALHPALTQVRKLYAEKEAIFLHAVASPYRDRSHFDGQNVLESGSKIPYQLKSGWMNRLLGLLPRDGKDGIAFSSAVPLAMQGAFDVTTYAPSSLPEANEDLLMRVQQLYATDRQLNPLWTSALEARGMASGQMKGSDKRQNDAALGKIAAGFLAAPTGPRVAMIETSGWDTHSGQNERLERQLRGLDALIGGLKEGMGSTWSQTVVLVATEFGRTAAANGTGGTDHGTASAAMLLGGAVQGGRIVSDWLGLASSSLFEGRDLQPTLGLDALISNVCAQTFKLDTELAQKIMFPYAVGKNAMSTLLRA